MKRFLGYLMIILFMAGSICGIVFGIMYKNVNDKYQELNNQDTYVYILQLETTIDNLTEQIENLEINIDDLTLQLENKDGQLEDNAETIAGYVEQIEDLQTTIESLNSTISSLQLQISNLQEDLSESETLAEEYYTQILNLQSQITTLQTTIESLEETVAYYEDLVESYDFSNKYIIKFEVKDRYYDVSVVNKDDTFQDEIIDPQILGHSFAGWSIDGITPIELEGYTFTSNTTLTALFNAEKQTYSLNSEIENHNSDTSWQDININTYIDVIGYEINILEIKEFTLDNYLSITEPLTEFATVEDYSIIVTIPTSFIEENYSNITTHPDADIYFKAVFTYENNSLILTDFYHVTWSNIDIESYFVEIVSSEPTSYITSLTTKEYNLIRCDRFGAQLYTLLLSTNNGELELTYNGQPLTYTKSNSNIYYIEETVDDISIYLSFGIKSDETIEVFPLGLFSRDGYWEIEEVI